MMSSTKRSLFTVLSMALGACDVDDEPAKDAALDDEVTPDDHRALDAGAEPCIAEDERIRVFAEAGRNAAELELRGLMPAPLPGTPVKLGWPIKQLFGDDLGVHAISRYVDHNPAAGPIKDFACGNRTYDGHFGTDIALSPFAWDKMDDGQVAVVAAAAGTIIGRKDGQFDRHCEWDPNAQANYVIVAHADGTRALYYHMRSGSVTAKQVGQTVVAGEQLGLVGSSGISSGPHLHFELHNASDQPLDPWAGPCNGLGVGGGWLSQRPYDDTAVNRLATYAATPEWPTCPEPERQHRAEIFCAGDTPRFGVHFRTLLPGAQATLSLVRPDNSVYWSTMASFPDYAAGWSWVPGKTIPLSEALGTWRVRVQHVGKTYERSFTVAAPGGPAITVPGWFGAENQGADLAIGDVDRDGALDVLAAHIDNPVGENTFHYRIGWALDGDHLKSGWSAIRQVPGTIGPEHSGAGVALTQLDGDPRPELVALWLSDLPGENTASYRVGFNLGVDGTTASWGPVKTVPGWFGAFDQGAAAAVRDLDGDGKPELVVVHVDAPAGPNTAHMRIGWDLSSSGTASQWSALTQLPGGYGESTRDIGVTLADLDSDGRPELVVFYVTETEHGINHGHYRIGWKVDALGKVTGGWTGPVDVCGSHGESTQGVGIAADTGWGTPPTLVTLHIDDLPGENTAFLRMLDLP